MNAIAIPALTAEERTAPPEPVRAEREEAVDGNVTEPDWACRLIDGKTWLQSGSPTIEPLWGDEEYILAARLQPTLIAGSSGSGKTTVSQRVGLGAIGVPGFDTLLGFPVAPTMGRLLYLAADRSDQARLSMLRMVTSAAAWRVVHERLVVLPGPVPEDVAANPLLLRDMARWCSATLVIPDSLKDMAMKLSDDAVGAKVNQAFQHLVHDGRDVLVPHHTRKVGRQDGDRSISLDDIYGSTWIKDGAGSVVHLEKSAVDIELRQLKTPNGREASLRFSLTPKGDAVVGGDDPILGAVQHAGPDGASTLHVARCVLGKDKPNDAEVEKVRRELKKREALGLIQPNGAGGRGAKWVVV